MLGKIFRAVTCFSLALSFGCANHVRMNTVTESEVLRDLKAHTVEIDTDSPSLVTSPQIKVSVQESKGFRVKSYELRTQYDVSTSYQGARELYEVPMGVVLLPVGVTVNLLDFALLGLIPNSITDAVLDTSFAGLNPFMNIESDSRVVSTKVSSDKKLLDEKDEFLKVPLAKKEIKVSSSDGATMNVTLDENGKAEINLVSLSAFSEDIDRVVITASSDEVACKKEIDVSRMLRNQLQQASAITKKYAKLVKEAKGDELKQMDIAAFAGDLMKLNKLGFESESLKIEKGAMSVLTEEQKTTLKKEIDRLLKSELPSSTVPG